MSRSASTCGSRRFDWIRPMTNDANRSTSGARGGCSGLTPCSAGPGGKGRLDYFFQFRDICRQNRPTGHFGSGRDCRTFRINSRPFGQLRFRSGACRRRQFSLYVASATGCGSGLGVRTVLIHFAGPPPSRAGLRKTITSGRRLPHRIHGSRFAIR